jgi:hypothetical protein
VDVKGSYALALRGKIAMKIWMDVNYPYICTPFYRNRNRSCRKEHSSLQIEREGTSTDSESE